ncbi:MAG: filamentous hemagglutinin N-terminal domain-containing protein [Nitrospira sp.]
MVLCVIAFHISTGLAQVSNAPITSSGLNTYISDPTSVSGKTHYDITGGTRAGTNLFHSFGDFNVPNHNIANFLNDTGLATSNILGRVTGGNVSNILGTIQTTGFGNANLFLMNPAGITFGPNASLNVGGSVAFTTANYLRLADNGRFNAVPNTRADALLSTAPVAAYGFLGSNPGTIIIQGSQLTLSEGNGVSLVGGDITVKSGTLAHGTIQPAIFSAPGGQINFASVASPGTILAGTLKQVSNINGQSFRNLGTVQVLEKSIIDSSGDGGGTVLIRGGHLVIDDSRISANVIGSATAQRAGPNIDIQITRDATIQHAAVLETDVGPGVAISSGGVRIEADRISIQGVSSTLPISDSPPFTGIRSNTQGSGNSGNIILTATGNINFSNLTTLQSTSGFNSSGMAGSTIRAAGNAGNIELTSKQGDIQLIGGSQETRVTVTSQTLNSSGNTGTIIAAASKGDIVLDNADFFILILGNGASGQTQITAKNLQLMNGSAINDVNRGPVKPGGIAITLSNNLTVADNSVIATASISPTGAPAADIYITAKDIVVAEGSTINSGSFISGPGGSLKIVADTLQVTGGAQLSSGSTRAPSRGGLRRILGDISPSGDGGDITIQTRGPIGSVLIDGPKSGIFADTEGTGAGGTINLSAKTLTIQNGGMVSASTLGTDTRATGGSIIINATDQVTMDNGASITTSSIVDPKVPNSGVANAGNISINAGQQLDVRDGSSITTQATKASGGNIDIRAIDRIRFVNSTLSTSVLSADGKGGNIFIDPNVVIVQGSEITAKAVGGAGGNITFVTPLFLADSASTISAKSEHGVSGTITIQSPTSNLSGTVGQLASKTSPAQVLLQSRCVALAGGEQSTFILGGRDALPSEPGNWINSPVSMEHWTGEGSEEHASSLMVRPKGPKVLPAVAANKNEKKLLSLRQLTPPGFLVRTFASGSTGCSS